jgi:hypothetical protein
MQTHQTTVPTTTETRPSGKTFSEEVQERQEKLAAKVAQRRQENLRYRARYWDEPLGQKVKRLAQKRWLEFDAIRREVETFLPLINSTPAQIREYREYIARLVNQYRREAGWQ